MTTRDTNRTKAPILALAAVLALGACSSVREAIGVDRDPPDEFQVTVRAPLSMPPDFGLRAPKPGSTAAQDERLRDRTRQIVLDAAGEDKAKKANAVVFTDVSPAEAALLRKVGADTVDANIRQVVERETTAIELEAKGFVEDLMFWKSNEPPAQIVDPVAERRRIAGNTALGRPANTGVTPEIARKKSKGMLEGLF